MFKQNFFTSPQFDTNDAKVARLQLAKTGVDLDELSDAQSEYLGISKTGPFKPEMYRY